MGCDYYIAKVLYVYYNDMDYLLIELSRETGDYYYDFDEDEKDYEKKVNDYKREMLIPQTLPILVYHNDIFLESSYENKYKRLVEQEISIYHKKWNDIIKIIKVEERYERE